MSGVSGRGNVDILNFWLETESFTFNTNVNRSATVVFSGDDCGPLNANAILTCYDVPPYDL